MNERRRSFAVGLALASVALAAPLAGQAASADSTPVYDIEGVTVTTTRSAVDLAAVPQKLTVVTAEDIARGPAASVAEVLRRTTPVDVIEYPGLLTGLSIRGFRPQYSGINHRTLLLVDGRPAGTANLALLHPGGIERIEVLRGPAGALYGSNAMGGVVNVITRRSTSAIAGTATLEFGSFGGYDAAASVGGRLGGAFDLDLALTAAGRTSGYSVGSRRSFASDSLTKFLPDGSETRLPWRSTDSVIDFGEYRAGSGRVRLGYAPADRWRIDFTADAFDADGVQNPGDLNVTDWDSRSLKDVGRRSAELLITGDLGRSAPSIRVYHALETVDYYNAPVAPHFVNFRTPTRTFGGQIQDVIDFGPHELTVGADYTAAEAESEAFDPTGARIAPFSPNSGIHSAAALAQTRLALAGGRLIATGGARVDRIAFHVRETQNLGGYEPNSEDQVVVTPSVGARATIRSGVQLYGNLGRAFVTPDAFNVAGYAERRAGADRRAVFVTRGNPDLDSETSRSWDVGVSVRRPDRGIDLDLAYFHTDVRNRIVSRTDPVDDGRLTAAGDSILSITTYLNVDQARIRGLEAQASYRIRPGVLGGADVRLFATGTRILRAEERFVESGVTRRIRNVADLTVIGGIEIEGDGRFAGRLTARYVGERFDADYVAFWEPGEVLYPGYLVLDLNGSFRVGGRYRLGVALSNLGDEDYFEVRGYDLPGRSVAISLGADF